MLAWQQWDDNMATQAERISVLETKVDNLKEDVQINHQDIKTQLKTMYDASCAQHAELAKKLSEVEKFKDKWLYLVMGGIAVLGWATGHIDTIANFLK
jgi:hypothetical protein